MTVCKHCKSLNTQVKIAKRIRALRVLQEEIAQAYLLRDGTSELKLKDMYHEDAEFEIEMLQIELRTLDKDGKKV